MSFLYGFTDEMTKTARGSLMSMLRRSANKGRKSTRKRTRKSSATRRTPGSMSVGKGLMLGGAGAAGGMALGSSRGKQKGYKAGTGDVMDVAAKARLMGRREGVLAYHRALMQHRRKQG